MHKVACKTHIFFALLVGGDAALPALEDGLAKLDSLSARVAPIRQVDALLLKRVWPVAGHRRGVAERPFDRVRRSDGGRAGRGCHGGVETSLFLVVLFDGGLMMGLGCLQAGPPHLLLDVQDTVRADLPR